MSADGGLRNQLKTVRTRLGLSQQDLAAAAGVTRQAISGIESGLYAASAHVALRLAKALGCRVEELFWIEEKMPRVVAHLDAPSPAEPALRVALAQIDGQWVAHPLIGENAFRSEMVPADGIVAQAVAGDNGNRAAFEIQLLDEVATLQNTIAVAGCAPALSLWTRSAERWYPGVRIHWMHANSTQALEQLARGQVHIAGIHLSGSASDDDNRPYVRELIPNRPVVLVNFGAWEEGLLVAPGNPKGIKGVADLARSDVVLVNREPGAGSRLLLNGLFSEAGIEPHIVQGYEHVVTSHQKVAEAVQRGQADAGVSVSSIAAAYGLGFVPVRQVRYDLALFKDHFQQAHVRQLLDTLSHRWVRSQLQVLGGYDTSRTGELVGET